MFIRLVSVVFALAFCAHQLQAQSPETPDKPVDFDRDIRPILSGHCFVCHGPDQAKRQAELRLDVREEALAVGAITPGDVASSSLVSRIDSEDPKEIMPPPEHLKPLSAEQKELLKRWISQGAEYRQHWSYRPLARPAVPDTMRDPWCVNPIDAFILQRLQQEGIEPSPRASSTRRFRRVHLDLLGLPPATRDLLSSKEPLEQAAWQALVDKLLQSPHFGERMATPWLDVARFADTVGFHGDQNQRVFPYRDYVIRSFNENKPFDQFTVEQLAGDLLPDPTDEQLVATGFNRLNMMTREGGAQPKEYLAKYQADRVRTLGMAWLGLTTGCAECHDHKYDPFTTKDFYQLSAFFADIKQWGVYQDYDYTPNPELRGWSNDHPFPPEIEVKSHFLFKRQAALRNQLSQLARTCLQSSKGLENQEGALSEAARFATWKAMLSDWYLRHPDGWQAPAASCLSDQEDVEALSVNSWRLKTKMLNGSAAHQDTPPDERVRQVVISGPLERIARIKLDLLTSAEFDGRVLRDKYETGTIRLSVEIETKGGEKIPVALRRADATKQQLDYFNNQELFDVRSRWRLPCAANSLNGETLSAMYQFEEAVSLSPGDKLIVHLRGAALGRFAIHIGPDGQLRPLDPTIFEQALAECLDTDSAALEGQVLPVSYILSETQDGGVRHQAAQLESRYRECRNGRAFSQITVSAEPMVTRILPRGDWQKESGLVVSPKAPDFLTSPEEPSQRLTRLDLARWIVSRENPLTARVVANRLWAQFMGQGIVTSVDDFGAQGDVPSHPELLDWLASELIDSGWNIKHLVRLIVSSSAYQQDSRVRRELKDRDPNNRLLAYLAPKPLEAEFIRDQSLFASGLLNEEIGGPSVLPYQPPGYYSNLQFPDRDYIVSADEQRYRRGLYMHWQRTFPHPMLANFDAPSREDCVALRTRSNTPQQALTLLNDPNFLEAAGNLAARLVRQDSPSDGKRIETLYRAVLSRLPAESEMHALERFVAQRRDEFARDLESAKQFVAAAGQVVVSNNVKLQDERQMAELATWTAAARVVLNLQEAITRY